MTNACPSMSVTMTMILIAAGHSDFPVLSHPPGGTPNSGQSTGCHSSLQVPEVLGDVRTVVNCFCQSHKQNQASVRWIC